MALALYRKYRPATFAEVVGQEHVTEPLSRALESGRINHAYLFSGPRGCGKTSSARILARSLNCELGPTPEPCGVCPSCVSLAPGGPGNIDVTELDAASHGGVDDTRELRDRAFFAPAESRYRVFIVDEAHMITTQGFNALLKIVEEPPEHLVFVFATTEPEKVLPTIRSRTHHYPFRLIPPGTLRGLLEGVCASEGVTVAPAVYPLVIRAGGGSARDSLSVLDQLVSGAGPDGVTYERAVALLGVSDVALIDDVVDGLAAGDRAAVFEAVDRLVEAGHDPRRFAADLLQRFRDLTLLQAVPEAVGQGLVEAGADELARMADQAARLGEATLTRYGEILHAGLVEMRGATAPRLLLELLCARMLLPAATTSEAGLLERLERLERRNAIAPAPGPEQPAGRTFERPTARAGAGSAAPAAPGGGAASGPPAGGPDPGAGRADSAAADVPVAPSGELAGPGARVAEQVGAAPNQRGDEPDRDVQGAGEDSGAADRDAQEPPAGSVAAGAAPVDASAVRRVWPEILSHAKERKKRTGALLVSATVRAVEGDTLVLAIGTAPLARMLSEQSNVEVIAEALHAVLGVRWRVRCEHGDAAPPESGPARAGRPAGQNPAARGPVRDGQGAGDAGHAAGPPAPGDAGRGSGGRGDGSAVATPLGATSSGGSHGAHHSAPSGAVQVPGGGVGGASAEPGSSADDRSGNGTGGLPEAGAVSGGVQRGADGHGVGPAPGGGGAAPDSRTGSPVSGEQVTGPRGAAGHGVGPAAGGGATSAGADGHAVRPGRGHDRATAQGVDSAAAGSGRGAVGPGADGHGVGRGLGRDGATSRGPDSHEAGPGRGAAAPGADGHGVGRVAGGGQGSPPAGGDRQSSGSAGSEQVRGGADRGRDEPDARRRPAGRDATRPGRAADQPAARGSSARAGARGSTPRPGGGRRPGDGVPLPPEPPDDDVPPEDEDEMLAEAALPAAERPVHPPVAEGTGPEAAALELLTTHLGARAIDRR